MKDYVKQILRKNSKNIVIHVGTNNKGAQEMVSEIDNLCEQVLESNPTAKRVISELITREDERASIGK